MTLPPLPENGLPADEILAALGVLRDEDLDFTKATQLPLRHRQPASARGRHCRGGHGVGA